MEKIGFLHWLFTGDTNQVKIRAHGNQWEANKKGLKVDPTASRGLSTRGALNGIFGNSLFYITQSGH